MKYNCIIFDCDGVLVDSEAISAKIFQNMILELGFEVDFETVLEQITGTSMKENLLFISEIINGELPADFETEFRKRSYEAFKTDIKPINGIADLLKKIKVPVGVASSGPVEKIRLNLTTTILIQFFGEDIFSSYEIGSWKPDPEIYLHAAKIMGFKPGECAVIEDSEVGIMAAKAGGFDVFGFANDKNKAAFGKLGATTFSSMKELGNLLKFD
jgi:HAD superfamily hydrolase (TIGR01509 family)